MRAPNMFTRLKRRVAASGPATVVAVAALTVALCGLSFAATSSKTKKKSGVVITNLNQISPSVQKKLKGAAGAPGAPGAPGQPGAKGAQGPKGDQGPKGERGPEGEEGEEGIGVEVEPVAIGDEAECEKLGGANVRREGQEPGEGVQVCNGKPGKDAGSGPLAPGATETGTFAQQTSAESGAFGIWVPISFPIPLDGDTVTSASTKVEYVAAEFETEPCAGNYEFPKAAPGYLCLYESSGGAAHVNTAFIQATLGPAAGGSKRIGSSGAFLEFAANKNPELAFLAGAFAVTGCSASLPAGNPNKCP